MKLTIAAICVAAAPAIALAQTDEQGTQPQSSQTTGQTTAQTTAQKPVMTTAQANTQAPAMTTAQVPETSTAQTTAQNMPQTMPPVAPVTLGPPPPPAYDALGVKGWDTPFPPASDTIFADAGKVRSNLADYGIGVVGYSVNAVVYDLRGDKTPGASFNGKYPTYFTGSQGLFMTYDASKIGLQNGQFQVLLEAFTNSRPDLNPPRSVNIGTLAYFQSFNNDEFEMKLGYMILSNEFMGANIAGSFTSGTLGPQSALPVQAGFSFPGLTTPGFTFRYNGPNGFYDKVAVVRGIPNQDYQESIDHNDFGLRFHFPNSGAVVLDEIGLNQPSSSGHNSLWLRAGGVYNATQYTNFETGQKQTNYGLYALADYQFMQTDPGEPARGLYAGASINFTPPDRNLYTRYYEARLYGIGLLPGRPADLLSVVLSYNGLSKAALAAVFPPGTPTDHYAETASVAYSIRLARGVYLQPALALVKNITITPHVPLAVNAYVSLALMF